MKQIYEPKDTGLVIVPNVLRDAINDKLDAAFLLCPDAAKDRETLFFTLLSAFNEFGVIPDFELVKRDDGGTTP